MHSSRVVSVLCAVLGWLAGAIAHGESAGESRPRIGLVLSGGGARGAAHIGVLKALEDMNVPVDAIAGTSMGAVVGGLYASGLSAREIGNIFESVNWQDAFRDRPPRTELTFRRKQEDQNFLVRFPLGLRARRFQLPKGLIQGQTLNQMLRRLTLAVAHFDTFDELPTPFRAIATDLETGDPVVMDRGDLASAMRASLSAPGVFTPVERNGRLLVDGGLSENLPVDVAKAMGVDVIIVVDVGTALLGRDSLGSVGSISNQMLAILIRRDSKRQLALLGSQDMLIEPVLRNISSFDFGDAHKAAKAGEAATEAFAERLRPLALSKEAYQRYAQARDAARISEAPRIDFVRVEPGSERYAGALDYLFKDVVGKPLDPDSLAKRVTGYYGGGNLEALDYRLVTDSDDRHGLALTARRNSWGPNYVRFGLNLQDDLEGNSTYNAAARFVMTEFTRLGGEWVWDLQTGATSRVASEMFLPVKPLSPYFVLPHFEFGARNVDVLDDQNRVAQYRVRNFDYGLDFGREFGNWGEVRAGVRRDQGSSHVRIGDPSLPTDEFNTRSYFLRLAYDELDDVNFPRHGQLASLEWRGEHAGSATVSPADQIAFNWLAAKSMGRDTAVFWTSLGTTLSNTVAVRSLFPLGGFLNLSGLKPDSINGANFGIARAMLYRQIGHAGPGFLEVPTYLGVSLEAGNVWDHRRDASFGSLRKDASIFLGLDTLLGPVYLATGFEDGGPSALYLFLGRTF